MSTAAMSPEKAKVETLKVLVADDDPPTRMLLRAAMSQWGYEVVEATDGEDAWRILQDPNAPQLLILDWMMPNLNGVDLCNRIRQEMASRNPYIILLTQVAGSANIVKGLEAGANEFLSKPFNMAELRSRLSVGARMIKYSLAIIEQNKQLQSYVSQIEAISALVSEVSNKINDTTKTNEINENIKQILTMIQNIEADYKKSRTDNL